MKQKENEQIMKTRWTIAGIIALILITILHLWTFLLMFVIPSWLVIKLISWLTGADLDNSTSSSQSVDNVSDTMWDIYLTDLFINQRSEHLK